MAKKKPVTPVAPTPYLDIPPESEPAPELKTDFEKTTGLSPTVLEKIFTANLEENPTHKKLRNLIADRIREGRTWNLANYKTFAAIDAALDSTYDQVTETLVNRIMQAGTAKGVLEGFKSWGIESGGYCEEVTGDYGPNPTGKEKLIIPNRDAFIKTHVPAVLAYRNIRAGKLFNDRNQNPLLKFEPVKNTEKNRMIGEIITDLVSEITHTYGYSSILRQVIIGAANYGFQFMFPTSIWDTQYNPDESIKREGICYNLPHPSRTFYDMTVGASKFNTDTGPEWAAYWRLEKFGNVQTNPKYWNKDKISYGTNWFAANVSANYFTEIYPCVFKNPFADPTLGGVGTVTADRETAAAVYNTASDNDKAVFLTDIFMKINPKQWELSDFNQPVWMRLVVANDCDVIWAEAFSYTPVRYCGWDTDDNRARNPSLALELLAYQNLLSNQLTSILLATKQNNTKIIPYDTDQIDEDGLKDLKKKNKDVTKVVFFPYSGKKFKAAGLDPTKMFVPVQFPLQNVAELTSVLNTIISIMERLLGMASSEVGAAGAHIQTAEEIRVIATNTSTRVEFTGSYIDDFMDAWKVQLFEAMQANMDDEFASVVTGINDDNKQILTDLGFELVGKPDKNGSVEVKGSRKKLAMQYFISQREGSSRINQPQVAQVILQTIQVLAQPALLQEVGAKEIVKMLNLAAQLLGAPKDFKIETTGQNSMMQQVQQELQALTQQIQQIGQAQQQTTQQIQQVTPAIQQEAQEQQAQGEAIKQIGSQTAQLTQAIQQIGPIVQRLTQLIIPPQQPPPQQQPPGGMQ